MKETRDHSAKRALCYVLAVLLFLFGAAVYAFPLVNRTVSANNAEETLENFRFVRSVYNDAENAPVETPDGEIRLTEAQEKAAQLTEEERAQYNKNRFTELRAAMQDYNQKIYQNHQADLKDAWSYEEAMFDLSEYGVENSVIAEIRIPRMNCDLPIYLGATWDNMAWGAVQLGQTSMPIGGVNTNCVIAGHRGCTNGRYFLDIEELGVGDKVYIDNLWNTLTYKVTEIRIIDPDDIPAIRIQDGKDMVTLVTCHPYPYNFQRYVVYCERTADDPPEQQAAEIAAVKVEQQEAVVTDPTEAAASFETEQPTVVITDSSTSFIEFESRTVYLVPIALLLLILLLIVIGWIGRRKRRNRNRTHSE